MSAFFARIPLRPALWERLREFSQSAAAASQPPVRARFIAETVAEFREAGADLDAGRRARLEAVQTEFAQLTQTYAENVLDATNAWQLVVEDPARLAGLPDHAKARALSEAAAKGLGSAAHPAWRFTLHMPSQEPAMVYLQDESIRREIWTAASLVGAVAPHDNTPLLPRILALRAEQAAILGKADFADLVLGRRMAKTGARALAFTEDFQGRCAAAFQRECRELEESKARETGGPAVRLAPWEIAFRAERMRRAHYDFDEEELRPYLPMDRVVAGLFEICQRVFGTRVTERAAGEVETWHPEVRFYDVHDSLGRHIGSFYADWHPRESKRGGAWMNPLATGGPQPDGSRKPHLGVICGNLTPPAPGRQALLSHREVETIFHEFGHLLHHLLGEVEIRSLNGTNVAWDFVELPSQIMENWSWEREGLDLFARHFESGAPIPEALFRKMTAARNFRSACVDDAPGGLREDGPRHAHPRRGIRRRGRPGEAPAGVHRRLPDPDRAPASDDREALHAPLLRPGRLRGGILFLQVGGGAGCGRLHPLPAGGDLQRRRGPGVRGAILSRGNAADPAELFRDFMGRDPDLGALLARSGLAA